MPPASSQRSSAPSRIVGRLRLADRDAQSVTLEGPGVWFRVAIVAPDLVHVRICRGRYRAPGHSWAVIPAERPAVAVQVRESATRVRIGFPSGSFQVSKADGGWSLTDVHGLTLFSADGGATRFSAGQAQLTMRLVEGEALFGLGEGTGTFNRRGTVRDFWNMDVLGHAPAIHPALKQLYVSIPFALSLRDGRAAGLFWDTPARQRWDLGQTILDRWQLAAESDEINLHLFTGPGPAEVLARYTDLTGRMPLPPRWGLGYQQSRYSYETAGRVREIAREFRRRRLPCDALYLDIHHMDGFRVFTFGKGFPRPSTLMKELRQQGFKVITIVDPGVKNDRKFGVLRRGMEADAFVKSPDGRSDFLGEVWPGTARFPDFLNPQARIWWGEEQAEFQNLGVAGFWNDMNEPANFARKDKTLHPKCRHHTAAGPRRHAEVHNLYGMEMARASREGALRHRPDERPFIITRAGYAGIQRHALVWTGDNSSTWDHLNDAVQMLLNLSVSGVPFCGSDVGGFLENTTPELFIRWLQFAAFTPFFRNHTNLGTRDQEPWAFGREVEAIARRFLNLRYQLIPYLYGRFAEARRSGTPIMRPLFWHYPNDPVAAACGDQFLLGRDLLVAPVLRQGAAARSVYLPADLWYDFWTGERLAGGCHVAADAPLDRLPLFVRAGAMVPMAAPRPSLGDSEDESVQLHCWPGAAGELEWYEDDGRTNAYESGGTLRRMLRTWTRGRTWHLTMEPPDGPLPSAVRTWRLVLRGVRRAVRFRVNGREAPGTWVDDGGLFLSEVPNATGRISMQFSSVL